MIVEFATLEAFLTELELRGPNLEPIIRVAETLQEVRPGAPSYFHTVTVSYLRQPEHGGVQIMTWRGVAGQRWEDGIDKVSRETIAVAEGWVDRLSQAIAERKYTAAGGTYLPGGGL